MKIQKDVKKFSAYKLNILELFARTELEDWQSIISWTGQGIITARNKEELKYKLNKWLDTIPDFEERIKE
jgi:hypothetical protein